MEGQGLLEKAKSVREGEPHAGSPGEHDDILAHIEKIAAQNRIQVSPQLFVLKPRKKGYALPVAINLAALVMVVGGLTAMYSLFTRSETVTTQESQALQSAEGKLLQEIRRQSEAELADKDKQLRETEAQLSRIQEERNLLAGNLEDRIRQREAALKAELEVVLNQERERLRAQGLSEAEIERRVQELAQQKTAQLNAQIATFRTQLEEEKRKAEAELNQLESQFNAQLSRINNDREALLADSRRREEELRTELAKAVEGNSQAASAAQERARAAQAEVERLNQAREQERNLESQINGFYTTIRQQISQNQLAEALSSVTNMKNFLRSSVFSSSETLVQRRERENFALGAIEQNIIQAQNAAASSELTKNAGLVAEAINMAQQARSQVNAGNPTAAAGTYDRLLRSLPGAAEAAEFRLAQERETQAKAQAVLQKTFQDQVLALRQEYQTNRTDELDRLNAAQAKAIEDLQTELTQVRADLGTERQGRTRLQGDYDALARETGALRTENATLRLEAQTATQALDRSRERAATLAGQVSGLEAKVAVLETALTEARSQRDVALAAGPSTTGSGSGASSVEINALRTENQTLSSRVSAAELDLERTRAELAAARTALEGSQGTEAEYKRLLAAYGVYRSRVTNLDPGRNDQDLTRAKLELVNFFNSAEAQKALPGLADTFVSFDSALAAAGSRNVVVSLGDKLFTIGEIRDRVQREQSIRREIDASQETVNRDFWRNVLSVFR